MSEAIDKARTELTAALNGYNQYGRECERAECTDTGVMQEKTDAVASAAHALLAATGGDDTEDVPDDEDAEVWNTHTNDLGDHCPYSGGAVLPEDDDRCPQGCRASAATTDPND